MCESLNELAEKDMLPVGMSPADAKANVVKAIGKGLLKTISKMGISTIQSYCGAQIFEAVGLEPELIDRHFTGTASRIGGIGMDVLAQEALGRHARAYPHAHTELLPVGGVYAWRREASATCGTRDGRGAPARGPPRRPGGLRRVLAHVQRGVNAPGGDPRPAALLR